MRIRLIIIFFFLPGCGSDRDNHGYGWHYNLIGETGLRVRYAEGQTTPSLADIEKLYRDTMVCTGIHATGPLIISCEHKPPVQFVFGLSG